MNGITRMKIRYEFNPDDAWRFARENGYRTHRDHDELQFRFCPYCKGGSNQDKGTFSINLKTGMFKCFRDTCGRQGNMITLAQDFDFKLSNFYGESAVAIQRQFRKLKRPEKPIEPKRPAIAYLESRGISEEVAKRYEITTQTNRDNVLVFPFYDQDGELVFIKYRKTDFDPNKDKAKEWSESGCKPILFGMKQCNLENKTLIVTEGQCFDGAAEVLTPDGWIRLENYGGQKVLQVNSDLTGSFVRPKQYIIKRHIGKMVHVSVGGNYESYTTDDHNIVYQNVRGELVKVPAIEHVSSIWHIPTAITIDSKEMSHWTNDMFALYLAISADGSIDYRKNTGTYKAQSSRYIRIAIAIERKYLRLVNILNNLGIQFSDSINARGYHSVCFHCPDWLESKYLPYDFATKTSLEQKRFIIAEMVEWDGNRVKGRAQFEYSTILKHNADVMQLIAASCGYMSTVRIKENGGNGIIKKGYCYKVNILLGKHNISTQRIDVNKTVTEVDQRVYCVSVDSGMILVRQNNKISVSGNCDSLSVAEAGIENAVSVPTGAKGFTWVPHCYDFVEQFDTIIVFGDHEKGHVTLLDEIRARFKKQIKCVREDDYKDCKDANDILRKYGKDQVRRCIENAKEILIPCVKELADVGIQNIFDIPKLQTGISVLDRLLYGGLPFGGVTLIAGKPGEGKSTLASQIIANAIRQKHKVFVYSGELPNELFRAWLDFQVAGTSHVFQYQTKYGDTGYNISDSNRKMISEWYRGNIYIYDSNGVSDESEGLVKTAESMILRYGCDVILIDNLMTALDLEATDERDKYERQSKLVKKLTRLCLTYGVLILLVAHKRKNNFSQNENDEISGSGDIANLGMVTLAYEKNSELAPEQRLLKISKNRLFGKTNTEGWVMEYDERSKRIYNDISELKAEFGWNTLNNGFVQINMEIGEENNEIPF